MTTRVAGQEQIQQKLTHPRFSYPTWSPDGTRILYESSVSGDWEIYVMDLEGLSDNGGNITQLTENQYLDRMPSWSPDGQFIAFISDRDGDFEVFRMRPDGTEQTQLTRNDVNEIHPYWAPDSQRIIFNSQIESQRLYSIWIMNLDGTQPEELLRDDDLNSYAQMSPNGELIVFDKWQDNDEDNGEIYVLELATRKLLRLTENQDIYDGYPTWTPNGQWIVYASEVGDNFKLFRIRPDGSGRQQVTFGPGSDARASISPDGTRILFNRDVDDNINIMLSAFPAISAGATAAPLPSAVATDLHPAIEPVLEGIDAYPRPSPDERSVAFVSDWSGNLEIHIVDRETGAVRQLTDDNAADNMPTFSPSNERRWFQNDQSHRSPSQ